MSSHQFRVEASGAAPRAPGRPRRHSNALIPDDLINNNENVLNLMDEEDADGTSSVDHVHLLSDHIGSLLNSSELSDVVLVVNEERIPAHRVVLASQSEYFRALLYNGLKESQMNEIELKNTPIQAFKPLLNYIYTGKINLDDFEQHVLLDVLALAHLHGFQALVKSISSYLMSSLRVCNVCHVYDTASLYQLPELANACAVFMDKNAAMLVQHQAFNNLSASALVEVLSRDSFCASEASIFEAVQLWMKNHSVSKETRDSILACVRLELMAIKELLEVVRPTGVVPCEALLDAIQRRTLASDSDLNYRGFLSEGENVASLVHGARVIEGESRQALLNGDNHAYDLERGFTRHPINENHEAAIVVQLGVQSIINHIKMLLWDRDFRSYSYFVEVSMDNENWVKVADHSRQHCRSWQFIYFPQRVVKYIKIVGTNNTINKVFHLVSLEAYFTNVPFRIDSKTTFVEPFSNVARVSLSAGVIDGVSRVGNVLLNGETTNYDWETGYTCHQLRCGSIVVQLGQPYVIGSMRMLLWDCDDRSYSYYVETSTNFKDWITVCDRQSENCRSWQTIQFDKRPIVYIKIVGTHNTANEVFHCVHFECPATETMSDDVDEDEQQNTSRGSLGVSIEEDKA